MKKGPKSDVIRRLSTGLYAACHVTGRYMYFTIHRNYTGNSSLHFHSPQPTTAHTDTVGTNAFYCCWPHDAQL